MKIKITPSRPGGTVCAPPSKSALHRALICALLSGDGKIKNARLCEDTAATLDCIRALGGKIEAFGDEISIMGVNSANVKNVVLPCRESGSTLRFFIPLVLALGVPATFTGTEVLMSRPLSVYRKICSENNFTFAENKDGIFVSGKLKAGEYTLPGNISSQFITGMLFGLCALKKRSYIRLIPPVSSRPYIDLTLEMMTKFGLFARYIDENTLEVGEGERKAAETEIEIEGDYSGAAFLSALNYLGGEVTVTGLNPSSLQGDKKYIDFFEEISRGTPEIDLEETPDLAPILFCLAACHNGARFTGTARLKDKESDRVEAMSAELTKMGGALEIYENSVAVKKSVLHSPAEPLCGHNDHRIVMALSCLLTRFGGEIEGAEAINKSFPDFFDRLEGLGVQITVIK